jgi:hypothetical protein
MPANNLFIIQVPVLKWLELRSSYLGNRVDLDWVSRDPIVGHLFPMLCVLNKNNGGIGLSDRVRQKSRAAYLETHARWLVREKRLRESLSVLARENIQAVPFKGGILQSQLYQNSGFRQMGDIDLLVRSSQFLRAAALLLESGFILHPEFGFEDLSALARLLDSALPTEIKLGDAHNTGLALDLHRHLLPTPWLIPGFEIDLDGIWARLIPATEDVDPQGLWKTILSPADTLAALILHLAMHGLHAMQTYLDLDLFIRTLPDPWDWDPFQALVNRWRIRSAAWHALSFCRDFMDTPLPDDLLKRLDPGWLARSRVKLLITSESILADRPSLGKRYPTLVKLALIDRLPRILVTLLKLAFPDKAWRQHNPAGRSLLAHWSHVLQVVKRGD